jgi:Cdc6-like AAA superfamily ATPase
MKIWRKEEFKDAEDFDGKVTPRSGGFWAFPGDVKSEMFLIDKKTTKKSYRITKTIWRKVKREAINSMRTPLLSVLIINDETRFIVIDENDIDWLIDKNKLKIKFKRVDTEGKGFTLKAELEDELYDELHKTGKVLVFLVEVGEYKLAVFENKYFFYLLQTEGGENK